MPDVMPIPAAERYFPDINGAPLVSGYVYYYVADSDTPRDTYQDQGGTILNSNPIVLDERGMAPIWGIEGGIYRERVLDSLGNEVYDRVTQVPCICSGDSTLPVSDEGTVITDDAASFNFVGDGVTATADGSGNVTVTVPGTGDTVAWSVNLANDVTIPINNGFGMNGGWLLTFDTISVDTNDAIDLEYDYGALPDATTQEEFYSPSTVFIAPEDGLYSTTLNLYMSGPDQANQFQLEMTHYSATGLPVYDVNDSGWFGFNSNEVNLASSPDFDGGFNIAFTCLISMVAGEFLAPAFVRGVKSQTMILSSYESFWSGYRVGPAGSSSFYEATLQVQGTPTASQVVMLWPFAQDVRFTANFGGYQAQVVDPPSVSIDFAIVRINANGSETSIGTLSIADDGTVSIVTVASPDFDASTAMKITAPSNLHGLADFAVTFLGSPV
jgi:hypothetical protein